jgi:iron complex transport system substrate-binding protein
MRVLTTLALSRRVWVLGVAAVSVNVSAATPRRIVSIGGAITETLYALGAQTELVGVDTTSLYPSAARSLPSVGYARQLSAEGVLSLQPTLVVAGEEAGPAAVLRSLEAARVPLVVLDGQHRFEGVLERTSRLAALCGREAAGAALTHSLREQWQSARERVARHAKAAGGALPRAMFILSHAGTPLRVAGRDTAADAMIGFGGGVNVFSDGFAGYKPLTPEAAVAAQPQVIVTTEQGLEAVGGVDGLLKSPGLSQTPAGRARRVVALDALLMLGFGPRLPQATLALTDALFTAPAQKS